MENRMARQICFVVAMSGIPSLSMAQGQVSPADVGNRALSQAPVLTSAQLADLVAPIALYPDALLSQVLVASTYPLEVVQAQQWLRRNDRLQGQGLMDAARQQPWDASVQGLVAFPDALSTLNEDIQWTTALGNAFLAQESDVMVAVQRLRTRAQAAGRLSSNPQQTVSAVAQEGRTVIEIVPADPQVIYVPQYDPYYVWGAPAWSAYPALSYGYGYGYGPGINVGFWFGGWSWGLGWGWGPNWYGGSVYVNNAFFRHCGYNYGHHGGYHGGGHGGHDGGQNGGGHGGRENWQHDSGHRMGVPYTDGRGAGHDRGGSQASRSTLTSPYSLRRSGNQAAPSSGGRAMTSGSRGAGADQGWRAGNRTTASAPRGGGADQDWRAGNRTTASAPRSGGADRGWSASGEQRRRSQGASQSQGPSARYSASSPRSFAPSPRTSAPSRSYSDSSPRNSAPSGSYSAPSRSYSAPSRDYSAPSRSSSSSAPARGFQSAPRMSSSGGAGRSMGGGSSQRSGGGGGSRGTGGGSGSGGSSRGGGRRH